MGGGAYCSTVAPLRSKQQLAPNRKLRASKMVPQVDGSRASRVEKKRQLFWRNVVKQFNFTDQAERELLLSLTGGICWMQMSVLPKDFVRRHREVYYLISTPEYERSGSIERDVTRTFSIFERSQQHQLEAQQSALFRVLNAIAEAEDGYCQGMNFIAALFLVEGLGEADAYVLFLYMLKKRHLAGLYHRSSTFLDEYLQHFEVMFRRDLPNLHAHLLAQGFALPMYGIEWFTTLFSLSTKTDLACAIFDLFFVGVQDIFLRVGLAILKLLEAKLMCMTCEDFLREFKLLVRELDPYQVILQALALRPNPEMESEDTTAHVSREHFLRAAGAVAVSSSDPSGVNSDANSSDSGEVVVAPPRSFGLHRTLPPDMAEAVRSGDGSLVRRLWQAHVTRRRHCHTAGVVLANELLHFAIWYGRVAVACLAIDRCGADIDNRDDAGLTPLHFSVLRNQPDMVRLLLVHGARMQETSMRRLSPLELAHRWKRRDTTAARLVLEKEEVCLFCNDKFDVLALETAMCGGCEFRFCCKPPHALCIFKHQCPRRSGSGSWMRGRSRGLSKARRLSEPMLLSVCAEGDDGNNKEAASDACDVSCSRSRGSSSATATSISTCSQRGSSHSLSRSVSESSSLGFVNSPAATSWLASPRFLEDIGDTSVHEPAKAMERDIDEHRGRDEQLSSRRRWQSGAWQLLEFPDRPLWYCNARDCHAVFALFTQAVKCSRCAGFFCSEHVEAKTNRCLECRRDLARSPKQLPLPTSST
ncbi:hypothetical protein BBJ28_00000103 [Nothophytophthora sp. Chile5]|nr:hypothetical protein BBJ28_00000103 [Nothophytophthora sp. Chile5]